jgi:hypothetical protein
MAVLRSSNSDCCPSSINQYMVVEERIETHPLLQEALDSDEFRYYGLSYIK